MLGDRATGREMQVMGQSLLLQSRHREPGRWAAFHRVGRGCRGSLPQPRTQKKPASPWTPRAPSAQLMRFSVPAKPLCASFLLSPAPNHILLTEPEGAPTQPTLPRALPTAHAGATLPVHAYVPSRLGRLTPFVRMCDRAEQQPRFASILCPGGPGVPCSPLHPPLCDHK